MLEGNLVNLRPIKKNDLQHIQSWINDLEVQFYSQEKYPVYYSSWFVKHIYNDALKGKKHIFMIENKRGEVIGELWLYPMDLIKKITELVIVIGKKEIRGRGYGKDAIETVKKYCFDKLNLDAIYLKVFSFNLRGINCYKACGFQIVGNNNKKVTRNGKQYDELIMVLKKNP